MQCRPIPRLVDQGSEDPPGPRTWRGYESKIRLHKADAGKYSDVQDDAGQREGPHFIEVSEGYSSKQVNHIHDSKQVNHIHDVLHAALEDARRMELIDRNVASLVETPRVVSAERKALTVEQANRLLDVTANDRLHALYRMLLTLGLRPGEGLGVKWDAIDFDADTLRVETTLQRQEGQWILKEPKTPKSKQTLPMPTVCAEVLKAHRLRQAEERATAGSMWQEWNLVFPRPDGQPSWYSDVGRALAKHCKAAEVPVVTMHELRHSTPSILLSLGIDQRVIMHLLRHSTIVLTANLYTHVADPLVRDAVKRIDDALRD